MASEQINREAGQRAGRLRVLVAWGGVGRTVLELLRGCQDIEIDYTDTTANNLQVGLMGITALTLKVWKSLLFNG